MKQDYRACSRRHAQRAQVDLDKKNYDRNAMFVDRHGFTGGIRSDPLRLDNDRSKLAAFQQQVKVQLAKLGGDPDMPTTEHPQYRQAKAQVAKRNGSSIRHRKAPFTGTVTSVPSIAPGKACPSTTAFFWSTPIMCGRCDAETELTYVRPDQKATVTVDTYPDIEWHGVVESV